MTTPTPTPIPLPTDLEHFLQVPGRPHIFAVFGSGLIRPALPSEWARRGATPVVTGTAADYSHAVELANALRANPLPA